MYETICRTVIESGARLIYTASRSLAATLARAAGNTPAFHHEACLNEKIAYELALAGSYASKRTACIFSVEGLYDALDPAMSSAYTGVLGGFVVVCLKETDEEITPLGLFSKLPVIVAHSAGTLRDTLGFAYHISEKYEIPVLLQVNLEGGEGGMGEGFVEGPQSSTVTRPPFSVSRFIKDPSRWAATPKFRYELHTKLNEKVELIREEFERYEGNREVRKGPTGIISCSAGMIDVDDGEWSELKVSTVFPLPRRRVRAFVDTVDQAFLREGPYPVLGLQLGHMAKVVAEPFFVPPDRKKHDETICGLHVVRDWLGPASALNMAHGMKKSDPDANVLAITFEDHFFHSGMPAFVNSLYNGSSYILVILTKGREEEIRRLLAGFGFVNCHTIADSSEVAGFSGRPEATVLFFRGFL
jgi:TPP-dependent indolepyruvate ferredoxin oxidoreductase alpha subunit